MKNSLTNPVRYNKIIVIEAVLLTVGIHFLFFCIFSVPEVRQYNAAKQNTVVTLLRFAENDVKSRELQDYIQKYDPGHFAGTHSPIGYNALRPVYIRKSPRLVPLGNDELKFLSGPAAAGVSMPAAAVKNIPLPRRELAQMSPGTAPGVSYPFAVSSSGTVIPLTFSTDEQRMINEFPLSAGVYKIFKDAARRSMPRIVLLQSCGRRALDKLSIKILYQEISRLSKCADGEIFTVFYREPETLGGDF